jgi:hypothetical protein
VREAETASAYECSDFHVTFQQVDLVLVNLGLLAQAGPLVFAALGALLFKVETVTEGFHYHESVVGKVVRRDFDVDDLDVARGRLVARIVCLV